MSAPLGVARCCCCALRSRAALAAQARRARAARQQARQRCRPAAGRPGRSTTATPDVVTAHGHVEIDDDGRILHGRPGRLRPEHRHGDRERPCQPHRREGQCRLRRPCRADRPDARRRAQGLRRADRQEWPAGRRQRRSASTAASRSRIDTVYTPCKICNQPGQRTPVWQVKAERVVYDQVKHRSVSTTRPRIVRRAGALHALSVRARSDREICQRAC